MKALDDVREPTTSVSGYLIHPNDNDKTLMETGGIIQHHGGDMGMEDKA